MADLQSRTLKGVFLSLPFGGSLYASNPFAPCSCLADFLQAAYANALHVRRPAKFLMEMALGFVLLGLVFLLCR